MKNETKVVFTCFQTLYCAIHVPKSEKENELTTLAVYRRVYINRNEDRQVAAIMHHTEHTNLLRVGSLIFLSVGQLLPHQLQAFHTPNYIYPIGYKIVSSSEASDLYYTSWKTEEGQKTPESLKRGC